ncbi:zinc finger BED domain-containing protein RICESLEEPER 2-like [Tasmannia lanceolata]|uniref:zinc finger BED domain-containing protein RICESLEEPER 2-like n=1 Tax=Tasmannia lanceolata TaxID=3420 RepID=UPI004062F52D
MEDIDNDIDVLNSSSENVANTINTAGDSTTNTSKKRASSVTSYVWNHFTKDKTTVGLNLKAKCNYCKKSLACPTSSGISSLIRHLKKTCEPYSTRDKRQKLLAFNPIRGGDDGEEGAGLIPWVFNQNRARRELTIMLVMLELPFNTVDKVAFRNFMRVVQPLLNIVSRTTVRKEVLNIYGEETSKLKRLIIPAPHSGEAMADVVEMCLIEWNISKLTTITLDNASSNNVIVRTLTPILSRKGMLLQGGRFFHMHCAAHVINLIVQDGLNEIEESVIVIRGSVKYVRGSQARKQQFEECVLQEGISNKKGLCIDVCTRWNSTFLMLESAIQFESAFTRLKARDSNFAIKAPTIDDWKKAKVICTFLKVFFDATKLFSGHKYTTSNLYFHEVFEIQVRLHDMANHDDVSINLMAKKMQIKFDKYLKECNVMFAIAVVLDPRYKIEYLSFMLGSTDLHV